ncbi:MAG: YceD family protein [Verrucomicrobiota bacterium]|nr:YceD family protein [Limisphaera sp.]MDW8380953.1 YceD family protein [Verrucomicrobiota bacterium]
MKPLQVSLERLLREEIRLAGHLTAEALELETRDELIRVAGPLTYALRVSRVSDDLVVEGSLALDLDCTCVRCLRAMTYRVSLPTWRCVVPLTGPEQAVREGDLVDLTPYVRDDIVLAFPLHPLCEPGCPGVLYSEPNGGHASGAGGWSNSPSVWSKLDELKLD